MARRITVEYDPEADAAYVFFDCDDLPRGGRTVVLGDPRTSDYAADYDKDGKLAALDLTAVSHGVDTDLLPHGEEVAQALRAAGLPVAPGSTRDLKPRRMRWTDELIAYMQKVGLPLPYHVKRRLKKKELQPPLSAR